MVEVKKKRTTVSADSVDIAMLNVVIGGQGNAVPLPVAMMLRMVAPLVARIAVRYVARRLKRHVSEATVRRAGLTIAKVVDNIITEYKQGD